MLEMLLSANEHEAGNDQPKSLMLMWKMAWEVWEALATYMALTPCAPGKSREVLQALSPSPQIQKALARGTKNNPDLVKFFVNGLREAYEAMRTRFTSPDIVRCV